MEGGADTVQMPPVSPKCMRKRRGFDEVDAEDTEPPDTNPAGMLMTLTGRRCSTGLFEADDELFEIWWSFAP